MGAAELMCIPHAIWIHNGDEKVLVKILRAEPRKSSESRSVLKAFQSIGTKVLKKDGIEQPPFPLPLHQRTKSSEVQARK